MTNMNHLAAKVGRLPSWQQLQDVKTAQKSKSSIGTLFKSILKLVNSF